MSTATTLKTLASRVRLACKPGARLPFEQQDNWQRQAHGYTCTLTYQRRKYTCDFWQGVGIERDPTSEGVLDCLLSDSQAGEEPYSEFCDNFGYDEDSRKAEHIWRACQATNLRMKKLLGDDYNTFLSAERG